MTNAKYMRKVKSAKYSSFPSSNTSTLRAKDFWSRCAPVEEGHPAQRYLDSRSLWPLLEGEALRCGRYTSSDLEIDCFCLVAEMSDNEGHFRAVQFLLIDRAGDALVKEDGHKHRITLGPAKSHAVWLVHQAPALIGVAEGLETAMAVRRLYDVPCWATLGKRGLESFMPPLPVREVVIFADHDEPGLTGAAYLRDRLRSMAAFGGRTFNVTVVRPPNQDEDYADVWEARQ